MKSRWRVYVRSEIHSCSRPQWEFGQLLSREHSLRCQPGMAWLCLKSSPILPRWRPQISFNSGSSQTDQPSSQQRRVRLLESRQPWTRNWFLWLHRALPDAFVASCNLVSHSRKSRLAWWCLGPLLRLFGMARSQRELGWWSQMQLAKKGSSYEWLVSTRSKFVYSTAGHRSAFVWMQTRFAMVIIAMLIKF